LAISAYSSSAVSRLQSVNENLGYINQSLHGLKSAWNDFWDAALNVGRQQTGREQFDTLFAELQKLEGEAARGVHFEWTSSGLVNVKDRLAEVRKELGALQDAAKADAVAANRASLSGQASSIATALSQEADQYATAEQKRAKAIALAHQQANEGVAAAIKVGNTKLAEQIRASEALVVAGIQASAPKQRTRSFAEEDRREALAEIEAEGRLQDQRKRSAAALDAYRDSLADSLATRGQEIDLQARAINMGALEISRQQELLQASEDYNRKRAQLVHDMNQTQDQDTKDLYARELEALDAYNRDLRAKTIAGFRAVDAARADFGAGLQGALADFQEHAGDVAGQSRALFTNAFEGMTDALGDFVATGKLDFSDLARSFIADLAKIELRILASQVLMSIFGGGATGASFSGTTTNSGAMAGPYNALGGVYSGAPDLSRYSGMVVSTPTFFSSPSGSRMAFASGGNVMGEAGPEAIMPLRRGPDGKLGVAAAGRSASEAPQVEINITNNGQAVQAQQTGQRMDGNKMIVDLVLSTVANDIASGGRVAKAGQQRFGWSRRGVPVGG